MTLEKTLNTSSRKSHIRKYLYFEFHSVEKYEKSDFYSKLDQIWSIQFLLFSRKKEQDSYHYCIGVYNQNATFKRHQKDVLENFQVIGDLHVQRLRSREEICSKFLERNGTSKFETQGITVSEIAELASKSHQPNPVKEMDLLNPEIENHETLDLETLLEQKLDSLLETKFSNLVENKLEILLEQNLESFENQLVTTIKHVITQQNDLRFQEIVSSLTTQMESLKQTFNSQKNNHNHNSNHNGYNGNVMRFKSQKISFQEFDYILKRVGGDERQKKKIQLSLLLMYFVNCRFTVLSEIRVGQVLDLIGGSEIEITTKNNKTYKFQLKESELHFFKEHSDWIENYLQEFQSDHYVFSLATNPSKKQAIPNVHNQLQSVIGEITDNRVTLSGLRGPFKT